MDPLQEMMAQFHRPLTSSQELQRLRMLAEAADKQLRKSEADIEQSQIDSSQGRVEYFEKITIGAGATIAALVSFLGSHSATLHPKWILRSSLICLGLTMLTALYRNFRYPNYVMQIRKISWIRCSRYQQRCRRDYLSEDTTAVSIQTGESIDTAKTLKELDESDVDVGQLLEENEKMGERLRKQWKYAENLCLTLAFLSMAFLIWLGLSNF
jgi:hypothetical protein